LISTIIKTPAHLILTLLMCLNAIMLYAHEDADTVRIETSGNYITLPVTLNGIPKRFIFDTGCGANIVFRHATDSLQQVSAEGDSIESSTGRTEAAGIMQGSLKISKYDGDDIVPIYVTDVDSIMMLRGDGIVGMQYLLDHNNMNIKIDVQAKQIIFTHDKHLFDKEDGKKLRAKLSDNRLTIKMKVSPGIKVKNVVFDSGCDHLFALDSTTCNDIMSGRHSERFMQQIKGTKVSDMGGMYGLSKQSVTQLSLDHLTVAGLNFHNVDVETGGESLLGFPFLQAASVVFYSKGKRIKVEPYIATNDYRIVHDTISVKRKPYTITYNIEKVIPF